MEFAPIKTYLKGHARSPAMVPWMTSR